MTLGQMIQHLRRERGMLQDELAETLGISRQSVSKWETDAAVPELDRLLQLSDLFGVSLDELVRGEKREDAPAAPPPPIPEPTPAQDIAFPPRKIAGTILLCFAGLVWLLLTVVFAVPLEALVFASPFFACGAICFIFRRRIVLWCAWAVYALIDAYLQWATGTSRGAVLVPNFYIYGITAHHLIAWASVLVLLALTAITLFCFHNMVCQPDRCRRCMLISSGAAILTYVGKFGLSFLLGRILEAAGSYADAIVPATCIRILTFLLDWCMIAATVTLLVHLAALLRTRRK